MLEVPVPQVTSRQPRSIIVLYQITIQEATRAIFTSNPKKAARVDGLTFKVW
jgi:hypothetical protein